MLNEESSLTRDTITIFADVCYSIDGISMNYFHDIHETVKILFPSSYHYIPNGDLSSITAGSSDAVQKASSLLISMRNIMRAS